MMPSTLKLHIIVAIYSFAHLLNHGQAYITSGLPAHTHRAFLRKLTDDICNTDPGSLKDVNSATKVMSAWASAPEKLVRESGKDRAIRVEGLLKRMIDERRAGNEEAVARTENYNAVMKSWAISGERSAAALRCEQVSINCYSYSFVWINIVFWQIIFYIIHILTFLFLVIYVCMHLY